MKSKYTSIVILIIIIFCTFFSCKKHFYYPDELCQAEKLMNTAPDSALNILKGISQPETLRGKAKADYALLYAQACDKNGIFHVDDSLIQIAVDYYKNKNEDLNAAKSYFYLGCIYRNAQQDAAAIDAFLKSLREMPPELNNKLWMQIYYNIGQRYNNQEFYENGMNMYRKCLEKTKELGDSSLLFFPYRGIAQTYMFIGKNDSSLIYFREALNISRICNNTYWEAIIANSMATLFLEKGDTLKAIELIEKSNSKYPLPSNLYWKGKMFFVENKLDSAIHYLLTGCRYNDYHVKLNCYKLLYEIEEKLQNHTLAHTYIDSFHMYRDSIKMQDQRQEIQKLNIKHILEIKEQEEKRKEEKLYWALGFLFTIVVLGSLSILLFIRKMRKEMLLQQERLKSNDREQIIHSYLEEKLGEDVPLIEAATTFKQKKLQVGIDAFHQTKWKDILEEANKTIKPGDFIKLGQEELYKDLAVCFQEFINLLVKAYPKLSEDDIRFIIFSAMDFKTRLIAYCMNTSNGALRIRKNRLKKNMAEETFLMIFKS